MTATFAAAAVSAPEAVTFWILAPVALVGAFGMVLARNAVHSALFLVLTMGCLGVFYLVEQGPFIGTVQIIVYTGAIMILFLFVLMLVGRESADSVIETLRGQRVTAAVLGIGLAGLLVAALARGLASVRPRPLAVNAGYAQNVQEIAAKMFSTYVFAFEVTSALLITAAVGAMVLAHVDRPKEERLNQAALSRLRFRTGAYPGPLPGPGVFATSDSVATPALLPDGGVAGPSVDRYVEPMPLEQVRDRSDT